jgi:hypothetical protein
MAIIFLQPGARSSEPELPIADKSPTMGMEKHAQARTIAEGKSGEIDDEPRGDARHDGLVGHAAAV